MDALRKMGSVRALAPLLAVVVGCSPPAPRPPSVVVVSFDTTRADRLGAYGNSRGITPNLDHFATEATVFEHAYTQATATTPSHAALFTGRYPVGVMHRAHGPSALNAPTLAEVFRTYGYATGAFVGGGDLAPEMGLTAGFDTYVSPVNFGSFYNTIPPTLDWLDHLDPDQPFFAFVHSYDAHNYLHPTPFGYLYADPQARGPGQTAVRSTVQRVEDGQLLPTDRRMALVTQLLLRPRAAAGRALLAALAATAVPPAQPLAPEDVTLIRDVYDGGVAYADLMFGLLMAGLAERGLLEQTVVVVLSDHGELLGEEGYFHHCYSIDDAQAHVVLMLRAPGGVNGGHRASGRVGLIDVMPTLLALVGAVPPAAMDGSSLVPALEDPTREGRTYLYTQGGPRFRSVSVADTTGRLTYTGIPPSEPAMPDMLAAALLPGPGFEVGGTPSPTDQARLRDALVAWVREAPHTPTEANRPLPAALKQSLREHGYFDAGSP